MSASLRHYQKQNVYDLLFTGFVVLCAFFLVLALFGVFWELFFQSKLSVETFGFKFLSTDIWDPVQKKFGAASSIYGTVLSSFIAMIIAVPLSLGISLFLIEWCPSWLAKPIGMAIELLAAIPSIIFGMWGLFTFTPYLSSTLQPFLQKHFGSLPFFGELPFFSGPPIGIGLLPAGIILAFMILPYISSICRDIFALIPSVLKESAFGMGSTTWEVTRKVMIPYGFHGIVGACFLGLGRALGETMAVTFVIGNRHAVSLSLFDAGNSIASTLANEFNEASEPLHLSSLIQLGLILFVITFIVQVLSQLWLKKVQKSLGGRL